MTLKKMNQRYFWPALTALSVVLISCLAYLPTLAPSISWRNGGADSGDLAAAVACLGIPHPPGYPTYVLLGRLWTTLPLGGDVAYRLNLFSAAGAAVAAGLTAATIFLVVRRTAPETPGPLVITGALLGGLALALAPLTWSQATITEVYGPGLAGLSLAGLGLLGWRYQAAPGSLILAGLVGGLGLGLSPQILLLGPGALILIYAGARRSSPVGPDKHGWRKPLLAALAAFALGLTTFAYLPLRAAADPLVNWGDPRTPARFWAVVTMDPYHQYAGLLTFGEWAGRLVDSLLQGGQQLSWAGLGLALVGSYVLWRKDRPVFSYLLILTGLAVLARTSYPVKSNLVHLLPALYALALLSGLGLIWLLKLAHRQIGIAGPLMLGGALLVALLVRAVTIAPLVDASADDRALAFGRQTLADLPPNAIFVSDRDETTFSLWYQQALGRRPDVVVIDKRLIHYPWYEHHLVQCYPDLNSALQESGQTKSLYRPLHID